MRVLVHRDNVLPPGQRALVSASIVVEVFGTFYVSFIKEKIQGITKKTGSSVHRVYKTTYANLISMGSRT